MTIIPFWPVVTISVKRNVNESGDNTGFSIFLILGRGWFLTFTTYSIPHFQPGDEVEVTTRLLT